MAHPLCDNFSHPLLEHVLSLHHEDIGLTGISGAPLSTDMLLTLLVDGDNRFIYKFWSLFTKYNF